tara:strand:- start:1777 stop:2298 length:522 start_codon:yes stop_codon:yes gene_type:complete
MAISFEENSCLLVIDIQTDYTYVHDFDKFRNNIKLLLKQARKTNVPIIFMFEIDNEKSKWIPFWEELHGKRIRDKGIPLSFSKPRENEKVFIKHGFDSFFKTSLQTYLQSLNIKTIYFSGVLTGSCVLNTMFTSYNNGYRNILISNCCSDKNKKRHDDTIKNYKNYLFIEKQI